MIACGNCKQLNDETSRLCRFCSTNMLYGTPAPGPRPQPAPPRPKAPPWATPPPQQTPNYPFPQQQIPNYPPPSSAPAPYYAPPAPQGIYRCPRCQTTQPPRHIFKMSQTGLITMIALLVFFFPLFWIGLLIKEEVRVCPQCGLRLS